MPNKSIRFLFSNFKFSLTTTLVCLVLASVMLWCSSWQWSKYLQKTKLVESFKISSANPPLPFPSKSPVNDSETNNSEGNNSHSETSSNPTDITQTFPELTDKKVSLSGEFDFTKQFIVTNRSIGNDFDDNNPLESGHWLYTPFKLTNSDNYILVSRGFIPFADRNPESWKKYDLDSKTYTIQGVLKKADSPSALAYSNPNVSKTNFANIWYFPEIKKMTEQYSYPIYQNVYLQKIGGPIAEGLQGKYPYETITISPPPGTHFGYTFEWMILAFLTLLFGFLKQAFFSGKESLARKEFARSKFREIPKVSLAFYFVLSLTMLATLQLSPNYVLAEENPGELIGKVGIQQNLNEQLDLSLKFTDIEGKAVTLGKYFQDQRPVIITPVYYRCPSLCNFTLNALTNLLKVLELEIGKDFFVLTYSINPLETAELAKEKSLNYYKELGVSEGKDMSNAWQFLVGDKESIEKLSSQIGFQYKKDGDEYSHSAGIMIATPQGRISRYFNFPGAEFPKNDVRLSLVEASEGKIGNFVDQVLLFCFRFDHLQGKYSLAIMRLVQAMGISVSVFIFGLIILLRIKEIRQKRNA